MKFQHSKTARVKSRSTRSTLTAKISLRSFQHNLSGEYDLESKKNIAG